MQMTPITDRIFQIADDDGVYCTLLQGERRAVLLDTGYGRQPLREFVESRLDTEYFVVNSHGHPDHIGGNFQFGRVYAHPAEHALIRQTEQMLHGAAPAYRLEPLLPGAVLDLGGLKAEVVPLAGHTQGSIGLLLRAERLLIAGDALNTCLWMFLPESTSVQHYIQTLLAAQRLPFDRYVFGHYDGTIPKGMLQSILRNAETLHIDPATREEILGIETYACTYQGVHGESKIIFTPDKL